MLLMNGDNIVLKCDFDKGYYEIQNEQLLPYSLRGIVKSCDEISEEQTKDEIKKTVAFQQKNRDAIIHFLASRILNLDRENAKKILNAYHFTQGQDDASKARIAIACKAVSMTDNYWLKADDSDLKWKELNPRHNSLNKIVSHIALIGSSLTITGNPHTPELTGQGAYAKAWIREDDDVYLLKKGTPGKKESETEVLVSKILDCFNVPHVEYVDAEFEKTYVCKCKCMTTDDISIVTAEEIASYCNRNGISFFDLVRELDEENFNKMCVMDYLIANADRHMRNWGFYVNNLTGDLISTHPLFDHNNAFDEETDKNPVGGESLIYQGKSKQEVAAFAIKNCN